MTTMGETFFININCSKVLDNCDESQYTMCIDSTKMCIVYELTEWIRWMFSLEDCFYLMHENSVIHELEDIQFLSKLKNFEIRPCGRPNCVHKKVYRTFLDNLNLFVSWNNVKVHKYFLDKLTKMEKFSEENHSGSSLLNFSADAKVIQNSINPKAKTDYNTFFLSNNIAVDCVSESTQLTKNQVLGDSYISKSGKGNGFSNERNFNKASVNSKDKFNALNDPSNSENKNLTVDFEISNKTTVNQCSSPFKNLLKLKKESDKHPAKLNIKKNSQTRQARPFSVGELLSHIREDFKKHNVEETNQSISPSNNCSALEEENFGLNSNSVLTEDNAEGGRKRSRIRKRQRNKKKSKEEEEQVVSHLSTILSTSPKYNFNIPKSLNKPSHIRFKIDNDDDDLMEVEPSKDEVGRENENRFETDEEGKERSSTFLEAECENVITTDVDKSLGLTDQIENGFVTNNTEDKMECSSENVEQIETETKLIDIDISENISQLGNVGGSPRGFNQDLNSLLKLKDKFKNPVVFERFY